jgi:hypothetical protein
VKRIFQLNDRIIKAQRYQFGVDASENFCVRMEGTPWGQYAGSEDAVLRNAEAMAVGMFGHQFFCGVDEVRVLDSSYDENAGSCHVTVEGPVGPEYERQVQIPEPLWSVMAACETNCVSSCCGLDAFEIDAAQIRQWTHEGGGAEALAEASRQIDELIKALSPLSGEYFSRQLSFSGNSSEWAEMLGPWREAIKEAKG